MQLKVEFLGLARELAGVKETWVPVEDGATWRAIVRHLAEAYPNLVGSVITPDRENLFPSYMLNLDGRLIIRNLDAPVRQGGRLLLMFAEAGG